MTPCGVTGSTRGWSRQKMSKFKKKRPEHRGLPPLQKTFAETVVMLVKRYCY